MEKRRVNVSETVRTILKQYVRDMETKELPGRLDTLRD